MYRFVFYGILSTLLGLLVAVIVGGTLFPADTAGNVNPALVPTLIVITVVFLIIGLWLAYFRNSRDPSPNQVRDTRPKSRHHAVAGCIYVSMIAVEIIGGLALGFFDTSIISASYSVVLIEFVLGIIGAIIGIGYAKLRGYTSNMGSPMAIALYACGTYAVLTVIGYWQTYFDYPIAFLALTGYLVPVFLVVWLGLWMVQDKSASQVTVTS